MADGQAEIRQAWAPPWWAVLIIGLLLWGAAIGSTFVTGDVITLSTIIVIGSFLVPVTAVVWYLDHAPSPRLSPTRIAVAFVIAGTIGLLGASLIEYFLVGGSGLRGDLKVGLIEEFVKSVLIVAVAWGIRSFFTRDGMVLGAAVGFGFAALESTGYALASLQGVHGHRFFLSLDNVVLTELARGVLAPFGHGMWSAIVGGAIFWAARGSRLRYLSVVWVYLLASVLHAAFDAIGGVSGYVVVSIIGLIPLAWLWLRADGRGGVWPRRRIGVATAR